MSKGRCMRIVFGLVVTMLWLLPVRAAEPTGPMSLEAARSMMLATHPALVRLRAQVRASEARADQIATALNPTLAGELDARVGALPQRGFDGPESSVLAGVGGAWTITDFGRTSAQVRAARQGALADEATIDAVALDLLAAVDEAYWIAKAQAELVDVAKANLAAEKRHREEAERFVTAGERAEIDVARSRTLEARATAELTRAETAARQALVALGRAIGVLSPPVGVHGDWSAPVADESASAEALGRRAYEGRAEVVAHRRRVNAAEAALAAADKGQLPYLGTDARIGVGSYGLEEWQPLWQVGVTLTWPFYDGGRTSAAIAAARADLEATKTVLRELEVSIHAEVSAAIQGIASAKSEIAAAATVRDAGVVELRLAEQRWKQGLGTGIELADAQTRLAVATADMTRAELSLALSRAGLTRALGLSADVTQ